MIEPSKVVLPKAAYHFRVIKAVRGTSQKGQPKADVDVELINNPDVNLVDKSDGSTVSQSPNGMQIRHWLSFQEQSIGSVNGFLRSIGAQQINKDTLATYDVATLEGKTGCGVIYGKDKINVDGQGQPILNPYTNEPSTIADNKFTEFFAKPA